MIVSVMLNNRVSVARRVLAELCDAAGASNGCDRRDEIGACERRAAGRAAVLGVVDGASPVLYAVGGSPDLGVCGCHVTHVTPVASVCQEGICETRGTQQKGARPRL
jgi:hypothetical protein